MTIYDFIFTKRKPQKYLRHIVFWGAQVLFWVFWATVFFGNFLGTIEWIFKTQTGLFLHICYTYVIVYYFSPKYLETKQYLKFGFWVIIITLFTYVLFMLNLFWITHSFKESQDQQLLMLWYYTMNFIINGPPPVCAMFLTCKMLKNYYIKMEEKQMLVKETTNAEMRLLKAQIHPHFLFNTLNNIYSFALSKSTEAGNLVLKLKDTTKYMVYECDTPLVSLLQEIKMLEDYLELEKVRYGKRLDISTNIEGECQNKMITPLLMIPFVENSFKHGTSKMLRNPWIKLFIQIDENVLHFTLTNSKPANEIKPGRGGIGLSNVKKRLELLYPSDHLLVIESSDNTFAVNMQVPILKQECTIQPGVQNAVIMQ